MKTQETIAKQDHVVTATKPKNGKQKVPGHLIFSLVAGTIAGMVIIFAILWGVKFLLGM